MQRIHERCRRVHELRDDLKRAMAVKDRPTIERVVKELEVRLAVLSRLNLQIKVCTVLYTTVQYCTEAALSAAISCLSCRRRWRRRRTEVCASPSRRVWATASRWPRTQPQAQMQMQKKEARALVRCSRAARRERWRNWAKSGPRWTSSSRVRSPSSTYESRTRDAPSEQNTCSAL